MLHHVPSGDLSKHVALIWSLEHDHGVAPPCGVQLVPSGFIELSVHYGDPAVMLAGSSTVHLSRGTVMGQNSRPLELAMGRQVGLISAMLRPASGAALLGLPARELADSQVSFDALFGGDGRRLVQRLGEARSAAERVGILESFLSGRLHRGDWQPDQRVGFAVQSIARFGGQLLVPELAAEVGLGRRQLERLFQAHVGLSIKAFARVVRFQYALLLASRGASSTSLAYQAGFADQSHLIRDFKALSGETPGAYFARCPPRSDFYEYI